MMSGPSMASGMIVRREQEEGGYGGGGRFANNEDPDDHSPNAESQCNKTGQGCPGERGGGKGGGMQCSMKKRAIPHG